MRKLLALSVVVFMAITTSTAQADSKLGKQARNVALHGGITGTCHGCATPSMIALMKKVYQERFKAAGPVAQGLAVFYMMRESGGNPGAISVTGDYGGGQFNYLAHHSSHPEWYQPGRGFQYLIFDPWYGASAMWSMSQGGTCWAAWKPPYTYC